MLETIALYASIGGSLVALWALAWSAIQYVKVRRAELKQQRYENILELITCIAIKSEEPITLQLAAIFEMRNYTEYLPILEVIHSDLSIGGPAANILRQEMEKTIDAIKN